MREGTFKTLFAGWTVFLLILMIGMIYAAVHFIGKYW